MNAPIDTLAFAERFESAGFGHDQARALAAAFKQAQNDTRDGLVTTVHLDARLGELEAHIGGQMTELEARIGGQMNALKLDLVRQINEGQLDLVRQMNESQIQLVRQIADNGKDVSNRLWSTVTIIAGVSTAISATIGAGVALILKWGGI